MIAVLTVMMIGGRALGGAPLIVDGHGRGGAVAVVSIAVMICRWGTKQVPRNIRVAASAG
jgi:hypothetical protein